MYEKSSCHTLDRYNMEAQKQYFIENKYVNELKEAIEESFKVDNWPYVQDGTDDLKKVKGCFESMSRRSWANIILGSNRVSVSAGLSAISAVVY